MTYKETLDWMFAQLPMYQREGKTAFKKDLTNILAFSKELNFPEKKFKTIHVGGTNGKGSTSHMLASILQEAGYKVGLYTSPHLKNFTERIRINGKEIPRRKVSSFIKKYKSFLEKQKLSFFEMTVGVAFDFFAQKHELPIPKYIGHNFKQTFYSPNYDAIASDLFSLLQYFVINTAMMRSVIGGLKCI